MKDRNKSNPIQSKRAAEIVRRVVKLQKRVEATVWSPLQGADATRSRGEQVTIETSYGIRVRAVVRNSLGGTMFRTQRGSVFPVRHRNQLWHGAADAQAELRHSTDDMELFGTPVQKTARR